MLDKSCYEWMYGETFEWLKNIPKGANPNPHAYEDDKRVNLCSKYERRVEFNFKEADYFRGICENGTNQLIACYGQHDSGIGIKEREYTKRDLLRCCKGCPYCCNYESDYDNQNNALDLIGNNIFHPFYVFRHKNFDEYILEEINDYDKRNGGIVYFVSDGEFVKIGLTKNIKSRILELQVSNARKLKCLFWIGCKTYDFAKELESYLHWVYRRYQMSGEWFDILDRLKIQSWKDYFFEYKDENKRKG